MPTFTYGNHYIGLLSLIHVARSPDGKATTANAPGGGDLQLAFSHDGMNWHRQPGRATLVAPSNAPDLHPTYAACSPPLEMGDEIWIYYAEANSSHPTANEPRSQIRAASWRKDGFVSMAAAGKTPGMLTTPAIVFDGHHLEVNIHTEKEGQVRVALLGADAAPLPGFEEAACDPLRGKGVAHTVSWRGRKDLSDMKGTPVRVRITLSNARIFSFRFAR